MRRAASWLWLLLLPVAAYAHVGSKDVFEQVQAGPYPLFVTVRMPDVIPGVANVEVRAGAANGGVPVTGLEITPLPLTGEASTHPPAADAMKRSSDDPAFFTGGVWMMSAGSWQVRVAATGAAGSGVASVPVPAVAVRTLGMERGLGLTLAALGLFLVITMAGVVGAAVREARLPVGETAGPVLRRRGWMALGGSLAAMALILWGGAAWWRVEAASYAGDVYRPLRTTASVQGDRLTLRIDAYRSENRFRSRANNDFLADHGKLIHLYAIRQPEMDAAFHLHPAFDGKGEFAMDLPAMPPGEYRLYGDVVHGNGFPETLVATMTVPAGMRGGALASDDAEAMPPPVSRSFPVQGQGSPSYTLPDGYRMVWDRPVGLVASKAYLFHFALLGPNGKAATGMQPYLGMAGHAAFVKTDGTVFAHTHPEGSAAMASMMLANGAMAMDNVPVTNAVEFPYGFPSAGRYRILVQMKHEGRVETGIFDADVAGTVVR